MNSKAGLDLDAASKLNSFENGDGVLLQDDSVMTVFNTPRFSGAQDFSTIDAHDNRGSGVKVLTGSTLTLVNQASVLSSHNGPVRLVGDNGAGVTLVNSTITDNAATDIQLTFGARADLRTLTFGTSVRCDRPPPRNEWHHLSALERLTSAPLQPVRRLSIGGCAASVCGCLRVLPKRFDSRLLPTR